MGVGSGVHGRKPLRGRGAVAAPAAASATGGASRLGPPCVARFAASRAIALCSAHATRSTDAARRPAPHALRHGSRRERHARAAGHVVQHDGEADGGDGAAVRGEPRLRRTVVVRHDEQARVRTRRLGPLRRLHRVSRVVGACGRGRREWERVSSAVAGNALCGRHARRACCCMSHSALNGASTQGDSEHLTRRSARPRTGTPNVPGAKKRTSAGNDLDSSAGHADRVSDQPALLIERERRRLAGGADLRRAVRTRARHWTNAHTMADNDSHRDLLLVRSSTPPRTGTTPATPAAACRSTSSA